MAVISISITDKRPTVEGSPVIVCGNSDYSLSIRFDGGWSTAGAKTARFVYVQDSEVKYQDVVFTGTTVNVPVLARVKEVRVGIYEGDLQTSTPAVIPCEYSIRCGTATPDDPTPSQYDQILALLQQNAQAVAGIQIGGRNYLSNSAFLSGTSGWTLSGGGAYSSVDTVRTLNGHPSLKVVLTGQTSNIHAGANTQNLPYSKSLSVNAGESWTISGWYYLEDASSVDNGLGLAFRGVNTESVMTNIGLLDVRPSTENNGKWNKISLTMTATEAYTECLFQVWVRRNGTVWFTDLKAEKGNIATDWTPAPEDVISYEQRIAALEAALLAMGGES